MTNRFLSFGTVLVILFSLVFPMTTNAEIISEEIGVISSDTVSSNTVSKNTVSWNSMSGNSVSDNGTKEKTEATEEQEIDEKENAKLRVLFVGNSFTDCTHNLEGASVKLQLKALAKMNDKSIYIKSVARDGARLSYYCGKSKEYLSYHQRLMKQLSKYKWDYIVVQDYSAFSLYAYDTEMKKSFRDLQQMIASMQPQAKMLLYMTPGYDYRKNVTQVIPVSDKDMERFIGASYERLGYELGLDVVPVGMHISRASAKFTNIAFVRPNDKHPTVVGYYVAALCFYQYFFGEVPQVDAAQLPNCVVSQQIVEQLATMTSKSISLNRRKVNLKTGEKKKIRVTNWPKKQGKVTYLSLNPEVASVDSATGVIKAVGAGVTSVVSETQNGLQAFCTVFVERNEKFDTQKLVLSPGQTTKIYPKDFPAKVLWSSRNRRVATVNPDGLVTAKKPGKAVLVVRSTKKKKQKANYVVYVSCPSPKQLHVTTKAVQKKGKKRVVNQLTWKEVRGATKYKIYRSKKKHGTYRLIGRTKRCRYRDEISRGRAVRYYKVVASCKERSCDSAGAVVKSTGVKKESRSFLKKKKRKS